MSDLPETVVVCGITATLLRRGGPGHDVYRGADEVGSVWIDQHKTMVDRPWYWVAMLTPEAFGGDEVIRGSGPTPAVAVAKCEAEIKRIAAEYEKLRARCAS